MSRMTLDQFLPYVYIVESSAMTGHKPCALEQEVHFENLYKPVSHSLRRQEESPKRPSILSMLFPYTGPQRGWNYNPSYGYEPYWAGGDWVFGAAINRTNKGVPDEVCGRDCPEVYKHYGMICGRNKKFEHKTFENYCKLMSEDCTLRAGWLIAYRGNCQGEFKTFPTESASIPTRAAAYISNFLFKNDSTTINLDDLLEIKRITTPKH